MQPNQTTRMELRHNKSRFGYRNMYRFSSQIAILPHASAQCQLLHSPSNRYPKITHGRVHLVITKMIKLGERTDILVQGIREHVRLGPKLSETVKGKLSLGARILQVDGVKKVFEQKFNIAFLRKTNSSVMPFDQNKSKFAIVNADCKYREYD